MGVEAASEIARLRLSIDRAATATQLLLAAHAGALGEDGPGSPTAERKELCRQLAALRERVSEAEQTSQDPAALRAELATLLFFAQTLLADADGWRSTLDARIKERERQRHAALRERERLAARRERLLQNRNALQRRILQIAAGMAQSDDGEWRKTLPVFALGEGLTVCSVSVSCPRKGLRVERRWLVTLNHSRDDVLVRRG